MDFSILVCTFRKLQSKLKLVLNCIIKKSTIISTFVDTTIVICLSVNKIFGPKGLKLWFFSEHFSLKNIHNSIQPIIKKR